MPELPEVETVKRGLERTIVGKIIRSVDARVPKLFADDRTTIEQVLIGQSVTGVQRRAKLLLAQLSNGWMLVIHLKMTGQIIVVQSEKVEARSSTQDSSHLSPLTSRLSGFVGGHPEKAYEQQLPHKHTHVIITFTDGTPLYFNDLRKFGWMRLFPNRELGIPTTPKLRGTGLNRESIEQFLESAKHGPEPLGANFTLEYFRNYLKKRKTMIKPLLLDQSFIAGVGNIYADEALFAAAIKPTRRANSLKKIEAQHLYEVIRQVLELGITYGGTSMNSYRTVAGTPGGMREHLKVYGREGHPCSRCRHVIVRQKIGQRSAHFCPNCQH